MARNINKGHAKRSLEHVRKAAKQKFDPKNVLTPGHGMFPG
jgi:hypothetical protein